MNPESNSAPYPPDRSDDELARLDISALLRHGLTAPPGPRRTALFGDGVVGAAVLLDRLGTRPRSVAFLADTVRAGGLAYATSLPEPLPSREASAVVRPWLATGAELGAGIAADDTAARWLRAVATVIELRQLTRTARS
ncbi:hypothetical protein [Streptomyces mangrovisoli]|uniref:Uncharacterized protein n=1 Tax=Streptomyces mangrovisoli TaxID=1428628 RepID=A0A1J4P4T0_9ACTN|nr:hypothetical protein [Streptomyces mangrovisoli]OIJ69785.1 hypothetical protein WN71_000955 [Streptomyces mangrovisoli]